MCNRETKERKMTCLIPKITSSHVPNKDHSDWHPLQFATSTFLYSNIPKAIIFNRSKTTQDKVKISFKYFTTTQDENAKQDLIYLQRQLLYLLNTKNSKKPAPPFLSNKQSHATRTSSHYTLPQTQNSAHMSV